MRCCKNNDVDLSKLNQKYCYVFLISMKENRIVCENEDDEIYCSDILLSQRDTKGNQYLESLRYTDIDRFIGDCDNINVPQSQELKLKDIDQLTSYVENLDPDEYSGMLVSYQGLQYKFINKDYQKFFNIRYNQNDIQFQFIFKLCESVRDNELSHKDMHDLDKMVKSLDNCKVFYTRYPEYKKVYDHSIDMIDKIALFNYNNYANIGKSVRVCREHHITYMKARNVMYNRRLTSSDKVDFMKFYLLTTPPNFLIKIIRLFKKNFV